MASSASEQRRVQALIQCAGVDAMTIDEHAAPIGRQMLPLFLNKDFCIYFLTHQKSRKVSKSWRGRKST